jgi:hypothetical protein
VPAIGVLVPCARARLTIHRLITVVTGLHPLAVVTIVGSSEQSGGPWLIALVAVRTLRGGRRSPAAAGLLLGAGDVAVFVTIIGWATAIVALRQGVPVDLAITIRSAAAAHARRLVAMLGGATPVATGRIRVHIGTRMIAGL